EEGQKPHRRPAQGEGRPAAEGLPIGGGAEHCRLPLEEISPNQCVQRTGTVHWGGGASVRPPGTRFAPSLAGWIFLGSGSSSALGPAPRELFAWGAATDVGVWYGGRPMGRTTADSRKPLAWATSAPWRWPANQSWIAWTPSGVSKWDVR